MIEETNQRQKENLLHNIAWLRRYYGISKKRMAQLLGIGISSLNQLEAGSFPPMGTVEIIFNLHDQFGYPMGELFLYRLGEDNTKFKRPPVLAERE